MVNRNRARECVNNGVVGGNVARGSTHTSGVSPYNPRVAPGKNPLTESAVLSLDTSAEGEHRQVARWRAMRPEEKLRLVAELNAAADQMALAGLRLRHPTASEHERFLRLALLKLGDELARQAYPEIAHLDVS